MNLLEQLHCEYYLKKVCTSCELIEVSYSEQIRKKEGSLLASLKPLLVTETVILPTVRSEISGFRNKAKFAVTGTASDPIIGLTGSGDLDQGREILNCPIHHSRINEVITKLPELLKLMKLTPYQIKEKRGELKGIIAFYSESSNEMYLRFILRSTESIERIKKQVPLLQSHFPWVKVVTANLQPIPHAILEGKEEIFLTNQKMIRNRLGKFEFPVHPQAFIQTNQNVALKLYETAASWISELKVDRFCELYSGQGPFSFFVSQNVKEALGIEVNEEAVKSANEMAENLRLSRLRIVHSDAQTAHESIASFSPEVILVNPPRRGLGRGVEMLKQNPPPYLLYSSCSHETLSVDLYSLSSVYEIERVQIFDMFPHTEHFETLVLLKRRKN